MRVCHQQTVVADARLLALARRAMHRRALADRRTVADKRIALFALELQILRHLTNRRTLENMAVTADLRPLLDDDVRTDFRPLADLDMIRDDRIGTDLHILCDARRRRDHRRLMDVGKYLAAACHLFQLLQPQAKLGQTYPLSVSIRQECLFFTWENQPLSPNNPIYRWIMSGFPAFITVFRVRPHFSVQT